MVPDASDPNDALTTRYSLLSRLQDWGDQASWQDFFEAYWRLIYDVARKAGLTDVEAQEVVQETVIGVAKHIGGFERDRRRGSFKAWLLHQTRWRILDQFRKRPPHPSHRPRGLDDTTSTATVDRLPDVGADPLEAVWDAEWHRHLLAGAIEAVKCQVPPRQFQMFDFAVLQGLPAKRVSELLQVSVMQVHLAKHRIGRRLRTEIRRRERELREPRVTPSRAPG
ncbi:MAG: sigma-70 family RNA polymerase sigma factor [Verrucomicrobiales bacterium]|nr:sigma-70 family RNA polymerase sigma factor [Verrucomicrobiales bacterium]